MDEPGTSLLAWTTTPWTLPSNVALAVHPELEYAWTRLGDGEVVITALALAPEGEQIRVAPGRELLGLRYQFSDNDSSDPVFSYERNVITIGVLRIF